MERELNQYHIKRKHRELTWEPKTGKIVEREENFTMTMVITGELSSALGFLDSDYDPPPHRRDLLFIQVISNRQG